MLGHAVVYELLHVFLQRRPLNDHNPRRADEDTYATHIVEVLQADQADEIVVF